MVMFVESHYMNDTTCSCVFKTTKQLDMKKEKKEKEKEKEREETTSMTFHDSNNYESIYHYDRVNYMNNVTDRRPKGASMSMNMLNCSAGINNSDYLAVVNYTKPKTATSGHHEVATLHCKFNGQVQLKPLVKPNNDPNYYRTSLTSLKQLKNQFKYKYKTKSKTESEGEKRKRKGKKKTAVRTSKNVYSLTVACMVTLVLQLSLNLSSKDLLVGAIFEISPQEWLANTTRTSLKAFIAPQVCSRTLEEGDIQVLDVEWLLMTLQCDLKPLIKSFEHFLPLFNGPTELLTARDLNSIVGLEKEINTERSIEIWREYLSFDSLINYFYSEGMEALRHGDFCTFPTIYRLGQLRSHVLGSKLLSDVYDLIAIQLHQNCLIKALSKLPLVPYLVRDVVNIYMDGINTMQDLSSHNSQFKQPKLSDLEQSGDFNFDAEEAIAKNGPLSVVVQLSISLPISFSSGGEKAFKKECKSFLMELEERWQSMEMMNKMLSTDTNGIQRFNNYVMRLLIPTKYADACSKLSARG